jgi:hypothetical protein
MHVVCGPVLRTAGEPTHEERSVNRCKRWQFVCLAVCVAGAAGAQSLTRSTVDAGGGRSSGGGYQLQGTIGQADTQASAGATFRLRGGFWVPTSAPQGDGLFGDGFE